MAQNPRIKPRNQCNTLFIRLSCVALAWMPRMKLSRLPCVSATGSRGLSDPFALWITDSSLLNGPHGSRCVPQHFWTIATLLASQIPIQILSQILAFTFESRSSSMAFMRPPPYKTVFLADVRASGHPTGCSSPPASHPAHHHHQNTTLSQSRTHSGHPSSFPATQTSI